MVWWHFTSKIVVRKVKRGKKTLPVLETCAPVAEGGSAGGGRVR